MVRHGGGLFQRAAVLEIGRDAGRPEAVVAGFRGNAGGSEAPPDHRVGVGLGERGPGQPPGAAPNRAEQWPLRVVAQARAVEVGDQVLLQIVVAGHGMPLAAFLMEPHPQAAVLNIHVLDLHSPAPRRSARRSRP